MLEGAGGFGHGEGDNFEGLEGNGDWKDAVGGKGVSEKVISLQLVRGMAFFSFSVKESTFHRRSGREEI